MKKLSFLRILPRRTGFLSQLQFYPLILISIAVISFILLAYNDNPWPIAGLTAYAVLAVICTTGASVAHYAMLTKLTNNEKAGNSFGVNFAFIAIFLLLTWFAWQIIMLSVILIIIDLMDIKDARKAGTKKQQNKALL